MFDLKFEPDEDGLDSVKEVYNIKKEGHAEVLCYLSKVKECSKNVVECRTELDRSINEHAYMKDCLWKTVEKYSKIPKDRSFSLDGENMILTRGKR